MSATIERTASRLQARSRKLADLGINAHPTVVLETERAAASLDACAMVLKELAPASRGYLDSKQQAGRYILLGSTITVTLSMTTMIDSAAEIAGGRDSGALKKLGLAGAQALGAVLLALSGAEAAHAAAEALSILKDGLDTKDASKLRTTQARQASELFKWLDAVSLVANTWLFGAEQLLLAWSGRKNVATDVLYNRVALRLLGHNPSEFETNPDAGL